MPCQEAEPQGVVLPNRHNVHALNEIGCSAMVAEDKGKAAVQRKASHANVKAGANAGQATVLVGQGVSHSSCLHSHLQQQSNLQPIAYTQPDITTLPENGQFEAPKDRCMRAKL